MHEPYEVYGLDGPRQDAREALSLVGGLREDQFFAEARIRELEEMRLVELRSGRWSLTPVGQAAASGPRKARRR
jgi:hypothetical protein